MGTGMEVTGTVGDGRELMVTAVMGTDGDGDGVLLYKSWFGQGRRGLQIT